MAKTCWLEREKRKSATVAKYAALRAELMHHLPFSAMPLSQVGQFLTAARPLRFRAGEVVLQPADGPAQALLFVREGSITGRQGMAAGRPTLAHPAAVALATTMASKILRREVSAGDQSRLVTESLAELSRARN